MKWTMFVITAALLCALLPNLPATAQPPVRVWETGATAQAQPADAGTAPVAAAPDPAPDPTTDPGGFIAAAKGAFSGGGKLFFVVIVLWGLARMAYKFRDKVGLLASQHARAVVVGGTGVLAAAALSLASGGPFDWTALMGALGAAVALYMRPEPHPAAPAPARKA